MEIQEVENKMSCRVARNLLVATVGAVTALTGAACASSGQTAASAATTPVKATAHGPASTSSTAAPDPAAQVSIAPGSFAGEAVAQFGQAKVDAGYREMAEFAAQVTFRPSMLPEGTYTADKFTPLESWMTPKCAAQVTDTINKALAGDTTEEGNLESLTFYNFSSPGVAFRKTGPLVTNQAISDPLVSVDRTTGTPRLAVSFRQTGDFMLTKDGAPAVSHVSKNATYWLVPSATGSGRVWDIDGSHATFNIADPAPAPGN